MRRIAKLLYFYFMLVLYLPFHFLYLIWGRVFGFDSAFRNYAQAVSLLPGTIGIKVRSVFYYLTLEECSREITVEFGTYFVWRGSRIGRNVNIGARSIISFVDIGEDTLIGSHVNILSGKEQHLFDDINVPIRLQGGRKVKILIGKDCWIGNGSIVLADIEDKGIVAAGSVVVNPVASLSIVGGNPAKILKMRE